jgi:hypothetical protein
MSTDHVPEHQNQEAQLAELYDILMGNAAFGRLRGTIKGSIAELIEGCLGDRSPSAALRAWDQRIGDLRVMLNVIAKFRRDDKGFAEMELIRALHDPKYVIAGETIPLERTTAYTVFMVDPEITLALHQFFQDWWALFPEESERGISPPTFWKSYADEAFCNERYGPVLWPLFREISWGRVRARGEYYPESRKEDGEARQLFCEVLRVFGYRIADINTRRVGKRTMEFSPWGFPHRQFGSIRAKLVGNSRHFFDTSCLFGKAVEQSELLGAFTREDQQRVASWQFHLPAAMIGDARVYAICLRPEAEHAR